jgi:hypothetical protein
MILLHLNNTSTFLKANFSKKILLKPTFLVKNSLKKTFFINFMYLYAIPYPYYKLIRIVCSSVLLFLTRVFFFILLFYFMIEFFFIIKSNKTF